jgi:hypothetical protein
MQLLSRDPQHGNDLDSIPLAAKLNFLEANAPVPTPTGWQLLRLACTACNPAED